MNQRYVHIVMRWLWLLAAAAGMGGGLAYWASQEAPTEYAAKTRVMVGAGIDAADPDPSVLRAGAQLMQTYAELATTNAFLEALVDELQLDLSASRLSKMISVKSNQETQLLTIEVTGTDPELAVTIANAAAARLIALSPSNPTSQAALVRQDMQRQAVELATAIAASEERLTALQANLHTASAAGSPILTPQTAGWERLLGGFEDGLLAATDADALRDLSLEILNALTASSSARIAHLETSLGSAAGIQAQSLLLEQLAAERSHQAALQQALIETQRLMGNQTPAAYIAATEAQVLQLETQLQGFLVLGARSQVFDELAEARAALFTAQQTVADRQQLVLAQVANERTRLGAVRTIAVDQQRTIVDEIAAEEFRLAHNQDTLAALNAALGQVPTNQVRIVDPATAASAVVSRVRLQVIIGSLAGLVIASAVVLALEYFDDTIQSASDLAQASGVGVLGSLRPSRSLKAWLRRSLRRLTGKPPNELDPVQAEFYRMLGAKFLAQHLVPYAPARSSSTLNTAPQGEALTTLGRTGLRSLLLGNLVGGCNASEIASGLAIVLAQTGLRVILVDANFHEPTVAQQFGVDERFGLANILAYGPAESRLSVAAQTPNLRVLPAGQVPVPAFQLLASPYAVSVLRGLESQADLLIVVAAAMPNHADSLLLASRVDGILLVAPYGRVRRKTVVETVRSLHELRANLIGTLLDQTPANQKPTLRYTPAASVPVTEVPEEVTA